MSFGADGDKFNGAAAHPASPPRTAARDLPYELLYIIFHLASVPETTRPPHGGTVYSWDSYERAAPFSLVCRRWRAPAQAVLFASVALVGQCTARLFVSALEGSERIRPLVAKETTNIMLALDSVDEMAPASSTPDGVDGIEDSERGHQRATSELLITALEACSSAAHVHIRTLHHGVRERLLATLMAPQRTLITLVLGPKSLAARRWSEELWKVADGWDLRPTVRNLEHTGLLAPGISSTGETRRLTAFPTLGLRRLKLWHDWPAEMLVAALRSSPSLEYLDLYFERPKPTHALFEALKVPAASLRELRYLYNPAATSSDGGDSASSVSSSSPSALRPRPPSSNDGSSSPHSANGTLLTRSHHLPPLCDLLLPHLTSLRTLHCSSTEITPAALRSFPPELTSLSVKSLNSRSRFRPADLLAVLDDDALSLPDNFKALRVTDTPDEDDGGWGERARNDVRSCCERRGITFVFRMDFEHEGVGSESD